MTFDEMRLHFLSLSPAEQEKFVGPRNWKLGQAFAAIIKDELHKAVGHVPDEGISRDDLWSRIEPVLKK